MVSNIEAQIAEIKFPFVYYHFLCHFLDTISVCDLPTVLALLIGEIRLAP